MTFLLRSLVLSLLLSGCTVLHTGSHNLVVAAAAAEINNEEEEPLIVNVYEGPSANGGKCPSEEETIMEGSYARIHFTVSIDASSKTGTPGQEFESTRTDGNPIGVTIGHGEVIPGWDQGMLGLCQGDKVTLIVPPHLAYGEDGTGTGDEDIPGGATIKFDVEIISVMEGPSGVEDDEQARAMFEGADTDEDGTLSRPEFDAMFSSQIGDVSDPEDHAAIQAQLDQFWDSQDKDADGFLTIEEFMSPSAFDDADGASENTPEEEFAALDKDNDGRLSKEEIEGFFSLLGQDVPEDIWEHLDTDADGFISFEEFFDDLDDEEEEFEEEL